jgi:hypothetical protein
MSRRGRSWFAIPVTALAGLILFLRRPDALLRPQFFAEDGVIFFLGAYFSGLHAVLMPYGGYLHLVPRLVASVALGFDPRWAPAIYNVSAFSLQLSVVALLFSQRIRLPAKPALAFAFVLVPHTGEVLINLTSVQWSLALVLVLLLTAEDAITWVQRAFDYLVLVLCGLTGPFLFFLSPLLIIRLFSRRSRESARFVFLAGLIAAVQASYLYQDRALFARPMPPDPILLVSVMSGRLYGTFFGGYGISNFPLSTAWIALGLALSGLLAYLAFRPGPWVYSRRILGAAWLCLTLAVAAKFLREAGVLSAPGNGDRYFFLPHVLLAWLLVMEGARREGWKRLLPAIPLVVALILNLPYYRVAPLKDYAWMQHVQPIREGKAFSIPINPEGWTVNAPAKTPAP